MKELVRQLIVQQLEIFKHCGDDRQPQARPPISAPSLTKLDTLFAEHGGAIPPSYRAFLQVSDGIDDFSFSYHLFGSKELLSPAYSALRAEVLDSGVGLSREPEARLILIGHHPETTTRLFIDLQHEPLELDESVILDGDPGDISLHPSFVAFMRMRVTANEITIAKLIAVREGKLDDA